jgi:hypothetical protein
MLFCPMKKKTFKLTLKCLFLGGNDKAVLGIITEAYFNVEQLKCFQIVVLLSKVMPCSS